MLHKHIFLSSLLIVLAITGAYSQVPEVNADSVNIKNFKEEIYIQTDRAIYISGEQVWLKVHKFNRLVSSPVNVSKVIYLELLDNSGTIIKQLKISSDGYSAAANLRLADTLSTGNYLIRAYSNWMQNYPEDLFFYNYISVINPFKNIDRLVGKNYLRVPDSVNFFPEGGKLISGLKNRIGVLSLGIDREPVKIDGAIINTNGDIICPLQTDAFGFGVVSITPPNTETLFFQFTGPDGSQRKQPLPEIIEHGITIAFEQGNDNSAFRIRIMKKGNYTPESMKGKLVIISSGLVTFLKDVNFERDSVINVKLNSIPSGGSLAVLSDEAGNRIAERWIYNSNRRLIELDVKVPESEYFARQRVTVGITVTDLKGSPVEADLSVSVVKTSLSGKERISIQNRDENSAAPGDWYADLDEAEMNNRLLAEQTSGSINYFYNQAQRDPFRLPELGGQLVSGVLRSKLSHEPLKNADISLAFVGKVAKCQFQKTDSLGEFNFIVNKPGLSEIVIQPLIAVPSGYYVEFNQPFSTTFNDHKPPDLILDSTETEEINKAIISMQVNKIYELYRQQKNIIASDTITYDFFGEPDQRINLSDYIELTTVREVIREIVPDLVVNKRNKEFSLKLVNRVTSSSFENGPLVLVDGVPFYNIGKLLDVNSKEIERIDILNSRYFYTDFIFDGIVSFITKKGNLSAMESDNNVFRQVFEGCQIPQQFYSPDYTNKTDSTRRIPDFRNTLYWKPDLRSDRNGQASVTFFTSDEPGEYVIIVEGITTDGKSGVSRKPFSVK